MRLRDVELRDVDAYVSMRCDPAMMSELGGPLPREGIEAKVQRDVETVASGSGWIKMILPDDAAPDDTVVTDTVVKNTAVKNTAVTDTVAGTVTLWSHEEDGELISEVGWMVLPEFQGRGLGKLAVRTLLDLAREDGRWGLVHAFPGVTNGPSNGICRGLGFKLLGECDVIAFADRVLRSNHWVIDSNARPL